VITRLFHALGLCGCATGSTWLVDGRHVPIVTSQFERERRAVAEMRASRRLVRDLAFRGHVRAE
jgi:hypothetical protein